VGSVRTSILRRPRRLSPHRRADHGEVRSYTLDWEEPLILCDLTVSPTGEPMAVSARLDEIVTRYPAGDPVHRAVLRSRVYLEACCERARSVSSA